MSANQQKQFSYWKNQEPPKSGSLYTDPLFPPNANSLLGLDSNGQPIDKTAYSEKARNINTSQIGFARASEIFRSGYKLFSEKIEMDDVIQGKLGDCYFLSSVANLCKFPGLIMKLFKTKDTNKDGFYEIILYIDGKPQIVVVDDYLPIEKSTRRPCYAQSKGNELWVMLLEKAWAKVNGGYANIISGLPCEALEFLTGLGSLSYDTENMDIDDINEYKYEIVKNVQIADKNNCLISCSTSANSAIERVGLVEGHAYSLVSFHQITTSQGKTVYLFRIRNPWSQGEWSGDWCDKSKLWDEKSKNQVNFKDKEDGIFFMNDTDFFKYFTHVEICYILYDAVSATYTIEGDENLRNASVFNIQTEGDGFLSVSAIRKTWRANRELRDKILPTHISIAKYDAKPKSRLKTFIEYNGTFESFQTPTLNVKVTKGNYLIYVYRDYDHAQFNAEKTMDVKIICSAKFKHAQMNYDIRDKGFPLLQNIILQAEFLENNYNPDLGEDFDVNSNQIRGNGIGHIIYYISTPGYYLDFTGGTANVRNFIMLSPYLNSQTTSFHRSVPSGKYLVLLGLMNGVYGAYSFNCFTKAYTTNRKLNVEFDNNEIDLTLYTDINNDIKNEKVRERITQSLENAQKTFYFDIGDGKIQYKNLSDLQKTYGKYIELLDEVKLTNTTSSNLRWGIVKGEYVTFIGQFNGDQKEGKGLFITPKNIFAGEFKDDLQNGIGYTYNIDCTKLYYATYVNGMRKGQPITPEDEKRLKEEEEEKKRQEEEKKKEEELKKEQERLRKLEEERQALLKKQEEEKKRLEEELAKELKRAEEAKKAEEERIAAELKKAEEEKKRLEEERQKEIQRQKEELERLAQEEKKRLEEAAKQAEELKRKEEEKVKKALQEAEEKRKAEEEKIKAELEKLAKQQEEEAKQKAEELKKQEEALKKEAEEAKKQLEEAQKEAEKKAEELRKEAEKKAEEAKQKALEAQKEAERKAEEAKKEAEKKAEEAKKKLEEAQREAEKKAEELKQKGEEAKKQAQQKADEIKQSVEQTKDDAQKAAEDFNNFMQKKQQEMEERRRRREQRIQEEQQRMEQASQEGLLFGFFYPDLSKSKKRRQRTVLPFEGEIMDICVSCGCKIF